MKSFFLVENYHFGRPKTNFSCFKKWKAKKKKKKKKVLSPFSYFHIFFPSVFYFPPSLVQFSFIVLHFPFFLASIFPVGHQKISCWKTSRGHSAPAPPPPAVKPLEKSKKFHSKRIIIDDIWKNKVCLVLTSLINNNRWKTHIPLTLWVPTSRTNTKILTFPPQKKKNPTHPLFWASLNLCQYNMLSRMFNAIGVYIGRA